MYIVTGKLLEDSKEVAYGVYDTDKKKAMLMAKEQVKNLVAHGITVIGFEHVYTPSRGSYFVRKSKNIMWKEIPELNGKGQPVGKPMEILLGVNGYKEMKSFVTVNSLGGVKVYSKDEMVKKMAKDNNIIGAVLASDERIIPMIKNTVNDIWLIDCGFERGEGLYWQRANSDPTDKTEEKQEEEPQKHYIVGLHH